MAYYFLPALNVWSQAALLAIVCLVGVVSATMAERQLGLDAGPIVIDEVAGMIVTYLLVPLPVAALPRLLTLGAGFLAFRVFDILKPWPVDRIQHLPGGYGIMADDLLAGVYSNVALRVVIAFVIPRLAGLAP